MQLLVLLAVLLLMTLAANAVMVVAYAVGLRPDSLAALYVSQAVAQLAMFVVPVLFVAGRYYGDSRRGFLRLDFGAGKWPQALAGIAAMLLLVPLTEWLSGWNDTWDLGRVGEMLRRLQEQTEALSARMLGTDSIGGLLANLIVVALLPAVCEELFFRAGIQNLLHRWFKNPHAAVWAGAAIFSLGHAEVFSFLPRFVMGAMLGYLYHYGRSLLPNAAAHFGNNALVVVVYWLVARGVIDADPEAPIGFGWPATCACTLAAAAIVVLAFVRHSRREPGGTASLPEGEGSGTAQ